MRGLGRARRKLASTLAAQPPARYRFVTGTITTVNAGAAVDGNDAAFVTIDGSEIPAPYRDGYTPTVDDFVMVLLANGSPYIVGQIIGLPDF